MFLTSDLQYMQALGNALADNFNVGNFFTTILPFIPWVGILVLTSFGIHFVRKKIAEIHKYWYGY